MHRGMHRRLSVGALVCALACAPCYAARWTDLWPQESEVGSTTAGGEEGRPAAAQDTPTGPAPAPRPEQAEEIGVSAAEAASREDEGLPPGAPAETELSTAAREPEAGELAADGEDLLPAAPGLVPMAEGEPPAQTAEGDAPGTGEAPSPEAPPAPATPAVPEGAGAAAVPPPPPTGAAAASPGDDDIRFKADNVVVVDETVMAEGGIEAQTREFTITSDTALIDADQVWVYFVGNVVVGSDKLSATATSFTVNLETSKWHAKDVRLMAQPQFFESAEVTEPVYVWAERTGSQEDGDGIEGFAGLATTCDKSAHRHYELRSNYMRVTPGNRLLVRRPQLYLFGHRILTYPFDLILSFNRKDNRWIPEVGRNEVEGYYAKFAFNYLFNQQNTGLLRLHLTEKRGVGMGFDHGLDSPRHTAQLSLFYEPKEGALSSRLSHRWLASEHFTTSLSSDLQRNSGYSGSTETLANSLNLELTGAGSATQLGFQQSLSESSYTTSRRFTTAFTHRNNSPGLDWNVRATMQDSRYGTDVAPDRSLDAGFELRRRKKSYDWALYADDYWDLDAQGTRRTQTHRLPEFEFSTDTQRLGMRPLFGRLDTRASFSLGRYTQESEQEEFGRARFRFDFGGKEHRLGAKSRLRTNAYYYQSFYGEGSAQYTVGLNSQLSTDWGRGWNTRVQYGWSNPDGYAPIRLDYWGRRSDIAVQAVHLKPGKSRFDLSGGFDLLNDRWNTLTGRVEYMTSRSSKLDLQAAFDLNEVQWRPLNARWAFVHPDQLSITLGSLYDLNDGQLTQGTIDFDWRVDPKTRLELLTRYSGYTEKFDQLETRLTRDLHCFVGSVSYNKLTDDIRVSIGLKAFPSIQTDFGTTHGARTGGSY